MESSARMNGRSAPLALAGGVYWLVSTALVVPAVCFFSFCVLLWPVRPLSYKLYLRLEQWLCRRVNDHWVAAFNAFGFTLREYGVDVGALSEDRCFVIANHLSLLDHFVLMASFHGRGSIANKYLWLIFHIWEWTPLGIMWRIHGNFFISGGRSRRAQQLANFKAHLTEWYWKNDYRWVVVYPEGSRLFKIRESCRRHAEVNGFPVLQHSAIPRVGAFKAVLEACGPEFRPNGFKHAGKREPITHIIDATIGYKHAITPDTWEALFQRNSSGFSKEISIHYRCFNAGEVDMQSEEKIQEWLNQRWLEKDHLLAEFYKKDHFSDASDDMPKKPVSFSTAHLALVQLFWLAAFCAHLFCWVIPLIKLLLCSHLLR